MTGVVAPVAPGAAARPGADEGAALVAGLRGARRAKEVRVTCAVVVVVLVGVVLALAVGDYALSLRGALRALVASGDALDRTIVWELRLPRAALAVSVGAALGLAGGVFQTLFANPLASPDLLGVSGGATVAAVVALLVLGWSGGAVAGAAFVGAAVVAAGLHLVSRGGVAHDRDTGHRFVLTGVAVSFLCSAIVAYLLSRAQLRAAQSALVWTAGSLGAARWSEVLVVVGGLVVFGSAAVLLAPRLRALQLGPETATGLGVGVARSRALLLGASVGLVASATSVVGPVAFVALCAPPVARRLVGTGSPALPAVAAVGAAMVVHADLVAQHALPSTSLPTGVVTGAIGAPYLLWLLSRGGRT